MGVRDLFYIPLRKSGKSRATVVDPLDAGGCYDSVHTVIVQYPLVTTFLQDLLEILKPRLQNF